MGPYGGAIDICEVDSAIANVRNNRSELMVHRSDGPMDPNGNLRVLRDLGKPLGVLCASCNHRALIGCSTLIATHALTRKVSEVRFRCTKCLGRDVHVDLFWRPSEITRFMRRD